MGLANENEAIATTPSSLGRPIAPPEHICIRCVEFRTEYLIQHVEDPLNTWIVAAVIDTLGIPTCCDQAVCAQFCKMLRYGGLA